MFRMELSSPCFTTYSAAGASTTGAQGNVLLVNAAFSSSLATTNAICAFVASNDSNDDTQAIMASSVNELKATNVSASGASSFTVVGSMKETVPSVPVTVMSISFTTSVNPFSDATRAPFTLYVYVIAIDYSPAAGPGFGEGPARFCPQGAVSTSAHGSFFLVICF